MNEEEEKQNNASADPEDSHILSNNTEMKYDTISNDIQQPQITTSTRPPIGRNLSQPKKPPKRPKFSNLRNQSLKIMIIIVN